MGIRITSYWSKYSEKTEARLRVAIPVLFAIAVALLFIPSIGNSKAFMHPATFWGGLGIILLINYIKSRKFDEYTSESKKNILVIIGPLEYIISFFAMFGLIGNIALIFPNL